MCLRSIPSAILVVWWFPIIQKATCWPNTVFWFINISTITEERHFFSYYDFVIALFLSSPFSLMIFSTSSQISRECALILNEDRWKTWIVNVSTG